MKKTKLTLLFAFGLLVLGGAHEAQSVQAVAASNTTTVTGKVELDYTFTPSETPEMKQWINSTLADARTDLTTQIAQETDPDKRKIYQDTLKELQSTSADSISTTDAQGNTVINGILPNAQVTIGNQTVTADTKGNYTVKNVPKVEKDAVVSYQNSEVFEAPINTSNTNQDNLKVTANSSDISKAMDNMMTTNQASAQSIRYYTSAPIGTQAGAGRGTIKVIGSNNMVSCNEASRDNSPMNQTNFFGTYKENGKNISHVSKTDLGKFPLNSSDCAKSTIMGISLVARMAHPVSILGLIPDTAIRINGALASLTYGQSINCAVEAGQHAARNIKQFSKWTNVYCNPTRKAGNHYNCSWFAVNNKQNPQKIERLHTYR
ncbi:MAG: hypothetical protein FWE43_03380 [Streptococcaceae bacterium]|nr:hypothetical protein [Streptococcaceae bacterium]MCL2681506.1 hypothetical protein [Streptococcaceae bacterium]